MLVDTRIVLVVKVRPFCPLTCRGIIIKFEYCAEESKFQAVTCHNPVCILCQIHVEKCGYHTFVERSNFNQSTNNDHDNVFCVFFHSCLLNCWLAALCLFLLQIKRREWKRNALIRTPICINLTRTKKIRHRSCFWKNSAHRSSPVLLTTFDEMWRKSRNDFHGFETRRVTCQNLCRIYIKSRRIFKVPRRAKHRNSVIKCPKPITKCCDLSCCTRSKFRVRCKILILWVGFRQRYMVAGFQISRTWVCCSHIQCRTLENIAAMMLGLQGKTNLQGHWWWHLWRLIEVGFYSI